MRTWTRLLVLLALAASASFAADPGKGETDTRPVKREAEPAPAGPKSDAPAADDSRDQVPDPVLYGPLDFSAIELIAIQDGGRKKPLHTYAHEQIEQIVGRAVFASQPSLKLPSLYSQLTSVRESIDAKVSIKEAAAKLNISQSRFAQLKAMLGDPETMLLVDLIDNKASREKVQSELKLTDEKLDEARTRMEKPEKLELMDIFMSMWTSTRDWREINCILINYKPLKVELGYDPELKHFSIGQLLENDKWEALVKAASEKRHGGKDKEMGDLDKEVEIVQTRTTMLRTLVHGLESFTIIPHPKDVNGTWITLTDLYGSHAGAGTQMYYSKERTETVVGCFQKVLRSYWSRDAVEFPKASQALHLALVEMSPNVYPSFDALNREAEYNKVRPFGKAWVLYLIASLIALFALKFSSNKPLYYLAMTLYLSGLAIHVFGFVQRCLIAGRPPVSNMYESVIWVGFGAVMFGLIFELIYKSRYYILSGSAAGFLCLVLMDQLPVVMGNAQMPGFEANIKPLVPVLRDNFWLTVHVLTITLSYAAFMLGWALGHVTLTSHLIHPGRKKEHHELHQFIYRVIQVGVLLLTIGTILGGVWAYYSWGRFWGWDPKETWAFITLMCYLFVLHGRFTGWWGNFGMSVGSVACFLSVVMAWYGVNFVLGSLGNGGLHSYGTGAGGEEYVLGAVVLDVLFTVGAVVRFKTYQAERQSGGEDTKLASTDPIEDTRAEFAD